MIKQIDEYLSVGGLFNPEAMEHDKVRDLIIECRAEIEHLVNSIDEIRNVPLWDEYRCIEIANAAVKDYR
jgi:hypothetical protein